MRILTLPVRIAVLVAFLPFVAATAAEPPAWATRDLRAGIIGTDTSHVPAFTELLRTHPEWQIRVVAAYKGGSPDVPASADRVEKFAATLQEKYAVEIVPGIPELLAKVDVVLLESVDGRPHLAQAEPVLKAGKRLFIDKPMAASLDDVRRIVALSQQTGTPFFSSSSSRFHPGLAELRNAPQVGQISRVQGCSPLSRMKDHPDLFFYGIHGVEAMYTVMGPGCESVSRKMEDGADVTTGRWKDGRIGVYRSLRKEDKLPEVTVWGTKGTAEHPGGSYEGLVRAIAEFFQTGRPPVDSAETIEIFEFMTAAQLSNDGGGKEVPLAELRK
jgi:predicted dehydrogenase